MILSEKSSAAMRLCFLNTKSLLMSGRMRFDWRIEGVLPDSQCLWLTC